MAKEAARIQFLFQNHVVSFLAPQLVLEILLECLQRPGNPDSGDDLSMVNF